RTGGGSTRRCQPADPPPPVTSPRRSTPEPPVTHGLTGLRPSPTRRVVGGWVGCVGSGRWGVDRDWLWAGPVYGPRRAVVSLAAPRPTGAGDDTTSYRG